MTTDISDWNEFLFIQVLIVSWVTKLALLGGEDVAELADIVLLSVGCADNRLHNLVLFDVVVARLGEALPIESLVIALLSRLLLGSGLRLRLLLLLNSLRFFDNILFGLLLKNLTRSPLTRLILLVFFGNLLDLFLLLNMSSDRLLLTAKSRRYDTLLDLLVSLGAVAGNLDLALLLSISHYLLVEVI